MPSSAVHGVSDARLVEHQLGRPPREPWRVVVTCAHGVPVVIASPPRLDDGSLFPTLYWLTCPALGSFAATQESAGASARWSACVAEDPELASGLARADAAFRAARRAEAGAEDPCAEVGIAGQREPRAVKCLHAHLALTLAGIDDPVGAEVLRQARDAGAVTEAGSMITCADARCLRGSDCGEAAGEDE